MIYRSDQNNILLKIEDESEKLRHLIAESNSSRFKLIAITDFFENLFEAKKEDLFEAYIAPFVSEYNSCLSIFDPVCLSPILTRKLIKIAKTLCTLSNEYIDKDLIEFHLIRIDSIVSELDKILSGREPEKLSGLFFPVLEEKNEQSKNYLGLLENVTIQIRKSKDRTKFLIIPSELHLEQKIKKQIEDSWLNAIAYLKNKKIKVSSSNFEVLIAFALKEGVIIGNSLGAVLTIGFIEELLKLLSSSFVIRTKNNIVMTGGLDESGKIISTSKEIIRIKTEIVFYSSALTFCVPKINELDAGEKLSELKKQYPNRNLEIIGLTNLDDLLNRRNIIGVNKKSLIGIFFTYTLKKWKSILLALVLTIILSLVFVFDFDDNPSSISSNGQLLFVNNKNGKLLWTLNYSIDQKYVNNEGFVKDIIQIVDIDSDNQNEVLFTPSYFKSVNEYNEVGTVICYNKNKIEIWKYIFRDTVSSPKEDLQPVYTVELIDTTSYNAKKIILCCSKNATSFSSAIFGLDLLTGKRINKTLWCSGYTWDGIIIHLGEQREKYFIGVGSDNGLGAGTIWGIKLDSLSGVKPSTPEYTIKNFPKANLNFYIQIPKTDYENYYRYRTSGTIPGSLDYNKRGNKVRFATQCERVPLSSELINCLQYSLSDNFKDFDIAVTDQFSRERDSLVSQGVMSGPLTDTKEFVEIQKSKILYWKNGKWVRRNDMDKLSP